MNFLSPWWFLAGLLAVPTILLYLLKMKRNDVQVSSTLLWAQALADMRANTPFQKLRRNLLLLLQLLILAALVMALTRPTTSSTASNSNRQAIIIDASASMQSIDSESEMTRFELAVELAAQMIDNLADDNMAMLIVAGPAGRGVRTPLSSSRHELHKALSEAIEQGPYDCPVAVAESMQLAKSTLLAAGEKDSVGNIVLISDAAGVSLPNDVDLKNILKHVRVGKSAENIGVVALGVETTESQRRIIAGIRNFSPNAATVMVSFFHENQNNWIDSRELELGPGQQKSVVLEKDIPEGKLWIKLEPGAADYLELDNRAFIALPQHRPMNVTLISEANPVITRFLAAAQNSGRLTANVIAPASWTADTESDFIIFDNAVPEMAESVSADSLFINPPVAAGKFVPTGTISAPKAVNVLHEDPLLRYVNTTTLEIAAARRYSHNSAATELISTGTEPLLAYYDESFSRKYLLSFHLADSTWATDSGILILLSNMLDHTAQSHHIGTGQIVLTGQGAEITPQADFRTNIYAPGGKKIVLAEGADRLSPVEKSGFYTVRSGPHTEVFAANLLSMAESDIAPRNLNFGQNSQKSTQPSQIKSTRRLWTLFSAIALGILVIEWWIYHRRIGQ